jgi:hypothetical protein
MNSIVQYHQSDSDKCNAVQGLEPEEWDAMRYLEKLRRGTRALFQTLWRDFSIQKKTMARH